MYNEELKREYISDKLHSYYSFEPIGLRIFNKSFSMERRLEKDVYGFTLSEIVDLYKGMCSTSYESLNVINFYYKDYCNWCRAKGLTIDNQNHFEEVDGDIIKNCLDYAIINSQILTRKELEHIMSFVDNYSDRALLLALFEGICGQNMEDLVYMMPEDFIGDNQLKLHSGKTIKVSQELKELCLNSANEYVYKVPVTERELPYAQIPNVFKCAVQAKGGVNRKVLYNQLMRIKKQNDLPLLTNKMLMDSGRIDMIRNMQKETGKTVEEILLGRYTEEKYGPIRSITVFMKKYEDYIGE